MLRVFFFALENRFFHFKQALQKKMSSFLDTALNVLNNSWGFVKRHKKKFIIGGLVAAAATGTYDFTVTLHIHIKTIIIGGYLYWQNAKQEAEEKKKKLPLMKRYVNFL